MRWIKLNVKFKEFYFENYHEEGNLFPAKCSQKKLETALKAFSKESADQAAGILRKEIGLKLKLWPIKRYCHAANRGKYGVTYARLCKRAFYFLAESPNYTVKCTTLIKQKLTLHGISQLGMAGS